MDYQSNTCQILVSKLCVIFYKNLHFLKLIFDVWCEKNSENKHTQKFALFANSARFIFA